MTSLFLIVKGHQTHDDLLANNMEMGNVIDTLLKEIEDARKLK